MQNVNNTKVSMSQPHYLFNIGNAGRMLNNFPIRRGKLSFRTNYGPKQQRYIRKKIMRNYQLDD